MMWI